MHSMVPAGRFVSARSGLRTNYFEIIPIVRSQRLHQLRPARDWELRGPQAKSMSALRIQMHLRGNAGLCEGDVIRQ